MPEVVADPEELEAFAQALLAYAQQTRDGLARVAGQLRQMGSSTWQDQRYAEFESMFQEVEQGLSRAVDAIENTHAPYLNKRADELRGYLGS